MAALNIDVNAGDTVSTDFDNLPTGWYVAHVIESDIEDKEKGARLNLTWEILDGQFAKRRVWQREWAKHDNPDAQEIGQRMIRTLGKAMGMSVVDDDAKLRFKPVEIRVGLSKKQDGYEQRNEIKSARACGTSGAAAPQQQGVGAPAAGAGNRPWN